MKSILSLSFLSACCLIFLSCSENDPVAYSTLDEMSEEAKGFFGMQNSSAKSMISKGNDVVNQSFRTTMKSLGGSTGISTGESKDSAIVVDPLPWKSCAIQSEIKNADGSTTFITDYGDGCYEGYDDWKRFMFGKSWYTWKYSDYKEGVVLKTDYYSKSRNINFGGVDYWNGDTIKWLSNGRSTYSGNSAYDTIKQIFSGSYAYSDTSEYTYGDVKYSYKSMGKTSYDNKKSVTSSNVYQYETSAEFYRSTVLSPLVSDYSCYEVMPMVKVDSRMMWWPSYVSGRERIEYDRNGKSGKFEIDYGDGECDYIVFIYENGKVFRVDLTTDYQFFTKG